MICVLLYLKLKLRKKKGKKSTKPRLLEEDFFYFYFFCGVIFMQRLVALTIQSCYHPAPSTPKKVSNPHINLPGFSVLFKAVTTALPRHKALQNHAEISWPYCIPEELPLSTQVLAALKYLSGRAECVF